MGERFCGSVSGSIQEVAFELLVSRAVDTDAGVPHRLATAFGCDGTTAVRNGIAFKLDRVAAAITDLLSLLLLEVMITFGAKEQIPGSVADVLHVGESAAFALRLGSLTDVDAIFCDEFPV